MAETTQEHLIQTPHKGYFGIELGEERWVVFDPPEDTIRRVIGEQESVATSTDAGIFYRTKVKVA